MSIGRLRADATNLWGGARQYTHGVGAHTPSLANRVVAGALVRACATVEARGRRLHPLLNAEGGLLAAVALARPLRGQSRKVLDLGQSPEIRCFGTRRGCRQDRQVLRENEIARRGDSDRVV